MNTIKLVIVFCFLIHSGFAQKLKPATLFKIDSTILKVYGLKFLGNQITYHLSPSVTSKTVRIPRREINRIRFIDGKVEIVAIKPLARPTFMIPTAFNKGEARPPSPDQKVNKGPRPDRIYMKERGIIECKIIEVGDKEVKYVVITDSSQRVRTIKRKVIEKIERNNDLENSPLVKQEPTALSNKTLPPEKYNSPASVDISKPIKKQYVAESKVDVVKAQPQKVAGEYSYSTFTLGLVASQIVSVGTSHWTDEREGLGLKRSIGGSLEYTKRFSRVDGLATEVGFTKWASEYRWKNNTELLYTYSVGLSQLSFSFGPKFYLGKRFYVLPKAKIYGLQVRQTGRDGEAILIPNRLLRTIYWGGSDTFGYEMLIGDKFAADASISYNYAAKPFPFLDYAYPPNKPLHMISFRLGFGLSSFMASNK